MSSSTTAFISRLSDINTFPGIKVDQLVDAIGSLDDLTDRLKKKTWWLDDRKHANEIGPLITLCERLEATSESLLAEGNYTDCETIETLKKAASAYRKKIQTDEDIYQECQMIPRGYREADIKSKHVQGYVQVTPEIPFRVHLFSEPQIKRYTQYCRKEKYPLVHVDTTDGVLKQMSEQKQSLLYALIFKDGNDANDTISLAHAILADHTVPSVSYSIENLAHSITQANEKLILPSFSVIDFSVALMNAILLQFTEENMCSFNVASRALSWSTLWANRSW